MRSLTAPFVLVAALLAAAGCSNGSGSPVVSGAPASGSSATTTATSTSTSSQPPTSSSAPAAPASTVTTTVASALDVPWGLAFLPDGSALVTLRDAGVVLRVQPGRPPLVLGNVPGVVPLAEGGVLGIAVSPTFAQDATVFVYLTASTDNRVLRMTLHGNTLRPDRVIVQGIPKADRHNGGRLAFGPDGYLYIGTGDAAHESNSQDLSSLGGKILRVTRDGAPAPGNPFPGSRVWTLGHRNVEGMAWDAAGRMYASEFGQNTWDELNHIVPGANYGWPVVEGIAHHAGFVDPLVEWNPDDASPSGIAIGADGAVYLAALRGESLWRVPLLPDGTAGQPQRLLHGRYGRLRTVAVGPDGRLWIFTSNVFRGTPRPDDDRILILPSSFGR